MEMKCPCCSSAQVLRHRILHGFQTYRCRNCFFEFVHPVPDRPAIEKHYNAIHVPADIKDRIKSYIADLQNNPNSPKRDWFDSVLKKGVEAAGKPSLNILEIGSAYGYFIHYANQKGHQALGTESTPEFAAASEGLIKGKVLYVRDYNYQSIVGSQPVDLIYMEHVFEHIPEPDQLLNGIQTLLSRNTILYLMVPNSRGFLSRLLGSFWPWAVVPDHLYYYNKKAVEQLLDKYGLKIRESWTGDYFFRSIPQFYSLTPFINLFISALGKLTRRKIRLVPYRYRYPRSVSSILLLLPYWLFYPFIKVGSAIYGYNELVVIAGKAHPHE